MYKFITRFHEGKNLDFRAVLKSLKGILGARDFVVVLKMKGEVAAPKEPKRESLG